MGGTGRGNLLSWESDDLFESAVIARKAVAGEIEPVEWRDRPLSVAANQIVMMVHSHGAIPIDEITESISGACQFEDWSRSDTIAIGKSSPTDGLFDVRMNQVQSLGTGGLMMFGKNCKIQAKKSCLTNLSWHMMRNLLRTLRD